MSWVPPPYPDARAFALATGGEFVSDACVLYPLVPEWGVFPVTHLEFCSVAENAKLSLPSGQIIKNGRELPPTKSGKVRIDGQSFELARLICRLVRGPPKSDSQVFFLDGNRSNLSPKNLKWKTKRPFVATFRSLTTLSLDEGETLNQKVSGRKLLDVHGAEKYGFCLTSKGRIVVFARKPTNRTHVTLHWRPPGWKRPWRIKLGKGSMAVRAHHIAWLAHFDDGTPPKWVRCENYGRLDVKEGNWKRFIEG